ncbi:MAG: hypothetical protein ACLUVC_10680 [Longibaculum sp.]
MHIYNAKTGKWKESKPIKNKYVRKISDKIDDIRFEMIVRKMADLSKKEKI